ncbi:sugar transferase [Prosthecochloris sp. ZM]|uniref:glycosyltransferase n=1 Tax=Prosthecochloris sp. ZM TaxID=2283143 RepID=UPI000DF80A77|nr:glycosyltransferase [Prosthecochloris sp. ZM]RDD29680.1 sugar transferase [Prosthecochloris sp. ZM]
MPAPVALFVYARPDHTRRTIEALLKNPLAEETDVIVFSDAAKGAEKEQAVDAVREYVAGIKGFKSLTVHHRPHNYGLAKSIMEGVTDVISEYGSVIVLEDDIVTAPGFLRFMNDALERYRHESKVWHISGWNYPIDPDGLDDAFFWRTMNCWGWATWADRWKHFEKNPERLIADWDQGMINRFNLDGAHNFWGQVTANASGKLNTWAIFWYATIFERHGLCLNPTVSYVQNIGIDGSGENCGRGDVFRSQHVAEEVTDFPEVVEESLLAVERIQQFYISIRPSLLKRGIHRILSVGRKIMQ